MNDRYENRRENLWKEFDSYVDDVKIKGKHLSFFVERKTNEPEVSGIEYKPPETSYELICDTAKVIAWIEAKMLTQSRRTPRKKMLDLPEYEVYNWAALWDYVQYAKDGGYKKVLLSKKEFAMIYPESRK